MKKTVSILLTIVMIISLQTVFSDNDLGQIYAKEVTLLQPGTLNEVTPLQPVSPETDVPETKAPDPTVVTDVSFVSFPLKKEYKITAKKLNLKGSLIKVTYEDGHTEELAFTQDMVSYSKKPGRVKVKVTYLGKSASFKVRFNKLKQTVKTEKKIELLTRETKKLSVKRKGKGKITYKSSDTSVAEVDKKGNIKAVGEGTAKITVKVAKTNIYKPAKKTVKITVKNPPMDKTIFLTYDDGPGSVTTPALLDVLKKYNAQATFFLVGKMAVANPGIVKREFDEGHTVAIHTYTHEYRQIYAGADAYISDFNAVESAIINITGVKPGYFRFPGGGNNSYTNRTLQQTVLSRLHERGYKAMDWNAATMDATGVTYTAAQMYEFARASIDKDLAAKKPPVVLIHDSNAKTHTAEVTEMLLSYYTQKGYVFRGLNDYYGDEIVFMK